MIPKNNNRGVYLELLVAAKNSYVCGERESLDKTREPFLRLSAHQIEFELSARNFDRPAICIRNSEFFMRFSAHQLGKLMRSTTSLGSCKPSQGQSLRTNETGWRYCLCTCQLIKLLFL